VDGLLGAPSTGWDGGDRDIARIAVLQAGARRPWHNGICCCVLHAVQDRVGWVARR
jgi:NADH-quinone oxidoreductase subunit F